MEEPSSPKLQFLGKLPYKIKELKWAPSKEMLLFNTQHNVFVVSERLYHCYPVPILKPKSSLAKPRTLNIPNNIATHVNDAFRSL